MQDGTKRNFKAKEGIMLLSEKENRTLSESSYRR